MNVVKADSENTTFASRFDDTLHVQKLLTVKTSDWVAAGQPDQISVRIDWHG
jgi:hypothetical protein